MTVPILYLHRVVDIPPEIVTWRWPQQDQFLRYMITPCQLAVQLDWLDSRGYTTILPRDLAAFWDRGTPLPRKPIILTFDDGYDEWLTTVMPMLRKRGFVAEFYVTVNRIGEGLTWDDVRALARAGNGIGAHDMDHVQLAGGGVATASLETMRYQVATARRILEAELGRPIDSMAYVGGGFDANLVQIVREAGFSTARSIVRGSVQVPGERFMLRVSRIGVFDDVVDKSIANAIACRLDPAMADFEARVTGSNPG